MKLLPTQRLLIWSIPFLGRVFGFQAIHCLSCRSARILAAELQSVQSTSSTEIVPDHATPSISIESDDIATPSENSASAFWEQVACQLYPANATWEGIRGTQEFAQTVTLVRVGLPGLILGTATHIVYPDIAMKIANLIDDAGVFEVVSQDSSQFIQNILNTSGLMFSILVGQTYYFMYQQQEAIYLALFEEVSTTKSLLEQVALVAQGRKSLYRRLLECVQHYVANDLSKFNDVDPATLLSARPVDDPMEDILYLTSVGEPSIVYQTVLSLRQARARRLGALQRKLPAIHMTLLWTLALTIVGIFPLLGAGSQTIGGPEILNLQAWYMGMIVFAITVTMGVVEELRRSGETGAYNAHAVLKEMVSGLKEELSLRVDSLLGDDQAVFDPISDLEGSFTDVRAFPA
eukprot:Nitzschia sp. Nitz4//scaffold64_size103689//33060//34274//NITZ4_004429-RA/size103689-processed-gene-0.165-mRNA-1//1//CDS//3329556109//747//frame0